ncbi:PDZ domain-containing protein [Ferrimonas sediminum]|uniref:PDZ domain-containing protein n=1 Tax=Ferrimonas sediminum TaxID=718193 RepID=A0A1G8NLB1_9GAMM|nr:PDZ domain-containing protein [Ferrimonas sediminum]SDI80968.1 PDZ domain-containing protein [Ferrimonas sediminum]
MVVKSLSWGVAGVLVGALGASLLGPAVELPVPEPAALSQLQEENRLLNQELALLMAVVYHIAERHDIPLAGLAPADARQASADSSPATEAVVSVAQEVAMAERALAQIQQAMTLDQALQHQALSEGWAFDASLKRQRLAIWQQARQSVSSQAYGDALARAGLPNQLYVGSVYSNSEASRQGVQPGDVILAIDGQRAFNREDLKLAGLASEGASVEVELMRGHQSLTVWLSTLSQGLEVYSRSVR